MHESLLIFEEKPLSENKRCVVFSNSSAKKLTENFILNKSEQKSD